jgi:hydroxyacylglutathione hydrolase
METVLHVPAFNDNYIWLIRGRAPNRVAIVDPGDAAPVFQAFEQQKLTPFAILCTHHHGDHCGGIPTLRARYDVPVYGPANERIRGITHPVSGGVHIDVDGQDYAVLDVPGHTAGHIAYYGGGNLFCGDTLFSAGCGRLFEGTAEQMFASLERLAALPEDTKVYCAHEYTLGGLRFALAVEPGNRDALLYEQEAKELRAQGKPTLPSTIGRERRINPFLRTHVPDVRQAATAQGAPRSDTGSAVFGTLRRWKDNFPG